jgi:hypothetical protein
LFKSKKKSGQLSNDELSLYVIDFEFLKKGYVARKMLEEQLISQDEYMQLIDYFKCGHYPDDIAPLISKYTAYYEKNGGKLLDIDKIVKTAKVYAKGATLQYLQQKNVRCIEMRNVDSMHIIDGRNGSHGYGKGKILLVDGTIPKTIPKDDFILCVNQDIPHGGKFDKVDLIQRSQAVVVWNTGSAGHIPVVCRGLGKGCVIIDKKEAVLLNKKRLVEVFGHDGVVVVGEV